MNEEQVKQLIDEKLSSLFLSDRYVFAKLLQIMDGRNIQLGRGTGTRFGTATDQLLAFYGVIPVDQPATVSDASAQGGIYNQANAQSITDAVNAVILRLKELGLIAS